MSLQVRRFKSPLELLRLRDVFLQQPEPFAAWALRLHNKVLSIAMCMRCAGSRSVEVHALVTLIHRRGVVGLIGYGLDHRMSPSSLSMFLLGNFKSKLFSTMDFGFVLGNQGSFVAPVDATVVEVRPSATTRAD